METLKTPRSGTSEARRARRAGMVLLVAVGALITAGCALAFQRPTVRVAEVRLQSLSLSGGTLAVSLRIENPNRYALESQDFRYAVSFLQRTTGPDTSWVKLAEGRMAEPMKVPAHDTGSVTLHVPFDLGALGLAAGRLLRQGQLEYRFTGELRFHTPLGAKGLPFDQRGTFRP